MTSDTDNWVAQWQLNLPWLAGVVNNEPIRNFVTLIIHMSMRIRNNTSHDMGYL